MSLVNLARALAGAWVLVSLVVFALMVEGVELHKAFPLTFWVAAPLPLAYWVGSRLSRTTASWGVLVAGLAAAFVFGAWAYWDAFLGPGAREQGVAGMAVLVVPVNQAAALVVAVVVAWFLSRSAH